MKNTAVPQPGILPENPTLSVCMIVRDEEKVLPRCLRSVQDVADELIIADTGSQDNTVSVAKRFGAKVFHFEWCDDFAAARNESLKHATGDWMLQLDADEELLPDSISHLRLRMFSTSVLQYVITCDNGPACPTRRFVWVDRLFRNHPQIRYNRPYHESVCDRVDSLIMADPRWQVEYEPNIIIRHHGYEPSEMHKKCERGLWVMKSYARKNPGDDYILSKIGGAYFLLGRYDEAEEYYRKALDINPDWAETNFDLAMTLQKKNELDAAVSWFKKAIAIDADLAVAYAKLGAIYVEKDMLEKGIAELRTAVTINPGLAEAHISLAEAFYVQEQYDLAIKHCDMAVERGFKVRPGLLQHLEVHR